MPKEEDFLRAKSEVVPKVDLRLKTLEFLAAHTFRKPTARERKVLAPRGYDIFLCTEAETLAAVVAKHPKYFWDDELDYVNARPNLRDYVPPALIVALRSKELFLGNSFSKSQDVQLQMHEAESKNLQTQLPNAMNIMLPVSVDVQLDLEYFKRTTQILCINRFVRALDKTSDVYVADVGRYHPGHQLGVGGWLRDRGYGLVGALSAVVFFENR